MKKLLAVLLVLGMGSMASATIRLSLNGQPAPEQISIPESETIMIDVTTDVGGNMLIYLDVGMRSEGGYQVGTPVPGPALGDSESRYISPWYDYQGYDEIEITAAWAQGSTPQSGKIMEFPFHCTGPGQVVVILYNPDLTEADRMNIFLAIPEPMTMGLLGLGGLLLARRRQRRF